MSLYPEVFKFTSCCILKISHILPHEVRVWLIAICHTISYEVSYIMHEQTCQLAIIKRVSLTFSIYSTTQQKNNYPAFESFYLLTFATSHMLTSTGVFKSLSII